MIEQRKHQRFELRLPFRIGQSSTAKGAVGETKNISCAGVLVQAADAPGLGEPLEYFITLPSAPGSGIEVRLRCFGRIVRQTEDHSFAATLDRYEFLREPAERA